MKNSLIYSVLLYGLSVWYILTEMVIVGFVIACISVGIILYHLQRRLTWNHVLQFIIYYWLFIGLFNLFSLQLISEYVYFIIAFGTIVGLYVKIIGKRYRNTCVYSYIIMVWTSCMILTLLLPNTVINVISMVLLGKVYSCLICFMLIQLVFIPICVPILWMDFQLFSKKEFKYGRISEARKGSL